MVLVVAAADKMRASVSVSPATSSRSSHSSRGDGDGRTLTATSGDGIRVAVGAVTMSTDVVTHIVAPTHTSAATTVTPKMLLSPPLPPPDPDTMLMMLGLLVLSLLVLLVFCQRCRQLFPSFLLLRDGLRRSSMRVQVAPQDVLANAPQLQQRWQRRRLELLHERRGR